MAELSPQQDPIAAIEKAAEEVRAESDKSQNVKCDNHPDRKARRYTGGGAFDIRLCEECTPEWFKA